MTRHSMDINAVLRHDPDKAPAKRVKVRSSGTGIESGHPSPRAPLRRNGRENSNNHGPPSTAAIPQESAFTPVNGTRERAPARSHDTAGANGRSAPEGIHLPGRHIMVGYASPAPMHRESREDTMDTDFDQADPRQLNVPVSADQMIPWLAQQFSQLRDSGSPDVSPGASTPQQFNGELSFKNEGPADYDVNGKLKAMDSTRVREENRQRKKRWRAKNAERNKDNDLRCRIYKLAKAKFGTETSPEAQAYVENEFQKRRERREARQNQRTCDTGRYPQFSVLPRATDSAPANGQATVPEAVSHAENLIRQLLPEPENDSRKASVANCAEQLRSALADGSIDRASFHEALKTLSRSTDVLMGVLAAQSRDTQRPLPYAGVEDDTMDETPHRESSAEPSAGQMLISQERARDMTRHADAALETMLGMADPKTYTSRFVNSHLGNGNAPPGSSASLSFIAAPNKSGSPVDTAQIDAFLALANGGRISDDSDDQTISASESEAEDDDDDGGGGGDGDAAKAPAWLGAGDRVSNDVDVARLVDRMLRRTADRARTEVCTSPGADKAAVGIAVKDDADRARDHLSKAGLVVNSLVPASHGRAMSRLYKHVAEQTPPATEPAPARSDPPPPPPKQSEVKTPVRSARKGMQAGGSSEPRAGIFRSGPTPRGSSPTRASIGAKGSKRASAGKAKGRDTGSKGKAKDQNSGRAQAELLWADAEKLKVRSYGFPPGGQK